MLHADLWTNGIDQRAKLDNGSYALENGARCCRVLNADSLGRWTTLDLPAQRVPRALVTRSSCSRPRTPSGAGRRRDPVHVRRHVPDRRRGRPRSACRKRCGCGLRRFLQPRRPPEAQGGPGEEGAARRTGRVTPGGRAAADAVGRPPSRRILPAVPLGGGPMSPTRIGREVLGDLPPRPVSNGNVTNGIGGHTPPARSAEAHAPLPRDCSSPRASLPSNASLLPRSSRAPADRRRGVDLDRNHWRGGSSSPLGHLHLGIVRARGAVPRNGRGDR